MTQFGATDLLDGLMAHYPKDYFPGMAAEQRKRLYDDYVTHFANYNDEEVLEAFGWWLDNYHYAPHISDLQEVLAKRSGRRMNVDVLTLNDAQQVDLLRKLCKDGFTEDGQHYVGPMVSSAYQDFTYEGERNKIDSDIFPEFMNFVEFIKKKIRHGELI